jgi:hypothetical protein
MALPVVHTLTDCADFSKTVAPFIPQLRSLLQQPVEAWADPQHLYLSTNPLITAFSFSLFLFPLFWIVSEVNQNYSQVDRLWGILPSVFNAHYVMWAHLQGIPTVRLDTLLMFSMVWSVGIIKMKRRGSLLIVTGPFDIQLLEEGRIFKRFGRLSLVRAKQHSGLIYLLRSNLTPQGLCAFEDQPEEIFYFQYPVYLSGTKCRQPNVTQNPSLIVIRFSCSCSQHRLTSFF